MRSDCREAGSIWVSLRHSSGAKLLTGTNELFSAGSAWKAVNRWTLESEDGSDRHFRLRHQASSNPGGTIRAATDISLLTPESWQPCRLHSESNVMRQEQLDTGTNADGEPQGLRGGHIFNSCSPDTCKQEWTHQMCSMRKSKFMGEIAVELG